MGATCAATKVEAGDDYDAKSWSSITPPVGQQEQTDSSRAAISATRGKPTADLSAYDSFSGTFLIKAEAKTDGLSQDCPCQTTDVFCIVDAFEETDTWTGNYYGNNKPAFTISTCTEPVVLKGWQVSDQAIVLERNQEYFAEGVNGGGGARTNVVFPDEYFQLDDTQTITSETDLLWGSVKLSGSGAADRVQYPAPSVLGSAVDFGPASTLYFSREAPGFDRTRFLPPNPYRPTILLSLRPIAQGTATSVSYKLYINGTFVRAISLATNTQGRLLWAFSIKGLGDFSSLRPPDNNSSDDYDGWPGVTIKISATPNTGAVAIGSGTQLNDWVINYTA